MEGGIAGGCRVSPCLRFRCHCGGSVLNREGRGACTGHLREVGELPFSLVLLVLRNIEKRPDRNACISAASGQHLVDLGFPSPPPRSQKASLPAWPSYEARTRPRRSRPRRPTPPPEADPRRGSRGYRCSNSSWAECMPARPHARRAAAPRGDRAISPANAAPVVLHRLSSAQLPAHVASRDQGPE